MGGAKLGLSLFAPFSESGEHDARAAQHTPSQFNRRTGEPAKKAAMSSTTWRNHAR